MRLKMITVCLLIVCMLASLTACGDKSKKEVISSEVKLAADGVYPMECEDELTIWCELTSSLSTRVSDFGEIPLADELEARTGVKVSYVHPAQGQQTEQFNLMLASNELPDIISYGWPAYGAQAAIDNNYILDITEMVDKWAPNYKKYLTEIPESDRMSKTDSGAYYAFNFFRDNVGDCIYSGPIVRADLLEKVNLEVPQTIDEWEMVLRAFKNELNMSIPFSAAIGNLHWTFTGAFGILQDIFVKDGKVVYGPATEEWRAYLTKMNKWYKEGLIDNNIASFDKTAHNTNVLNNRVGATFGAASGGLGKWNNGANTKGFRMVGAPYPVMEKGAVPKFANQEMILGGDSYAITTQCKNPELAVRFLDYGYGEEGRLLYNFGIEGKSFEFDENGEPKIIEVIDEDDKLDAGDMLLYAMGSYSGPFVQMTQVPAQLQASLPEVSPALELWKNNEFEQNRYPAVTYTIDEQTEMSNIRSEIKTYTNEMTMKFITGVESLDKFDAYIKQLDSFGLKRLLEIYTGAMDRYNNR